MLEPEHAKQRSPQEAYRVVEASFVVSAPDIRHCPEYTLPEIAVAGRSNVGKSSLINLLCNQKKLAKTSRTPGKTRLINFFHLRIEPGSFHLHLVDLPGYGYTKTDKATRRRWGETLEEFLRKRDALAGILHLVDARHDPTPLDLQMREWIVHAELPSVTILTKSDKLNKNARSQVCLKAKRSLRLGGDDSCILSSVLKKQGTDEILAAILALIADE